MSDHTPLTGDEIREKIDHIQKQQEQLRQTAVFSTGLDGVVKECTLAVIKLDAEKRSLIEKLDSIKPDRD